MIILKSARFEYLIISDNRLGILKSNGVKFQSIILVIIKIIIKI